MRCIGECGITAVGAQALAEALGANANTALESLTLHSNSIRVGGACALGQLLETNSSLLFLNLSMAEIKDEGTRGLASGLAVNTRLTTLILSGCRIDNDGAIALAEALKTNTSLKTLNLMFNGHDAPGEQALAEALKTNTTLTALEGDWLNMSISLRVFQNRENSRDMGDTKPARATSTSKETRASMTMHESARPNLPLRPPPRSIFSRRRHRAHPRNRHIQNGGM